MADTTGTMASGVKRKRDFFDDEDFSDAIIKFGDKQVFAHKVILARGSLWFDRALSGNFSEANKKMIELHNDDNPEAVMAMLRHIYGSNYKNQDFHKDADLPHTAELHLGVFILGDKYDISSLSSEAAVCFNTFLVQEFLGDWYYKETIYAIRKLVGPGAPHFADQALVLSTTKPVLDSYDSLIHDEKSRSLLAKGEMLKNDRAIEFLSKISQKFLE